MNNQRLRLGYSFDYDMRRRLYQAFKALEDDSDRVGLNKIIMEIERPYIEKLEKIMDAING